MTMGKIIRGSRKGKGGIFKSHTKNRIGPVKMRIWDYAEKAGFIKGVVKEICHEPRRGAPVAKIQFQDPYRYKRRTELLVAPEGMYSGQFLYAGKKAKLVVGNVQQVDAALRSRLLRLETLRMLVVDEVDACLAEEQTRARREADRAHPKVKHRAVAAGALLEARVAHDELARAH